MPYCTPAQVKQVSGFSSTEISDDDITVLIGFADAEIDSLFNRSFGNATGFIEYVSLYLPKRADDIAPNRLITSYYPIQSISSILLVNATGTTTSTLSSISSTNIDNKNWQTNDYFINPEFGLIELTTQTIQFSPSKAKVSGTYGYSTTPTIISELSATITGIRAWLQFLGGNYNRLNKYELPEQKFDKGDFYDRGMKAISSLTSRANSLTSLIGEKYKSQFFSTSGGFF